MRSRLPLFFLGLSLPLLLGAAPALSTYKVEGSAVDAVGMVDASGADQIVVSTRRKKGGRDVRSLIILHPGESAARADVKVPPQNAVFFDACPRGLEKGDRLVFVGPGGLFDEAGNPLIEKQSLYVLPDPRGLKAAHLCAKEGKARGELRLLGPEGLWVRGTSQTEAMLLPLTMRSRAYSSRLKKGVGPDKPYGNALSVYVPHFIDADMDGDGQTDLVTVHEGDVHLFLRSESGALAPALHLDLHAKLNVPDDANIRVFVTNFDGDKSSELVVALSQGLLPKRTRVFRVELFPTGTDASAVESLWDKEGLVHPLGVVKGKEGDGLFVYTLPTGTLSFMKGMVTGEVPLRFSQWFPSDRRLSGLYEVQTEADLWKGRVNGALPVLGIDFDGDGRGDLLDLALDRTARIFPGGENGISGRAQHQFKVPAFETLRALPDVGAALMWRGATRRGKTRISVIASGASGISPQKATRRPGT
jgi:hypothetical protein